ncbi:MAG: DUF3619 family protein [Rhodoferax sp.]
MKSSTPTGHLRAERFARGIASELDIGIIQLHPDISERLRVARQRALAQRKIVVASALALVTGRGQAQLTLGELGFGWRQRIASMFPLLALVLGLLLIAQLGEDQRASELAEVDIELLTDDLPPDAYTDPGFARFLQQAGRD